MNVFNKVALEGLKKSRTRTLVTIIGVVLSAALITAVTTFGISMLTYVTNGAIEKYGDWHVVFSNVDSSFVEKQERDDSIANTTTVENIGYAKLTGEQDEKKPYLFIAGFSEEAFDTAPITLYSGRQPKTSSEILVSGSVQTEDGDNFSVGDTVSLDVGNRMDDNKILGQQDSYSSGRETFVPKTKKTYTVVGICKTPIFEESSAPGFTLITVADAAEKADNFSLFVTLKNPRKTRTYISSAAKNHDYIYNDKVLGFMGISDNTLFNTFLYSVGGVVIAIIMIGSIFLIYNSFNMSLNERTHQFGILASVGATAKQLRNSVLFEGFCIGVIGIPIGTIVGIGGIGLVISVVSKNFQNILYDNVPLTLTVSVPAIAAAGIISMVTILISAYIPAKKAVKTPVMECIRQTNEIKVENRAVRTSKIAQRVYGLEGTLALKNFKRNKKQYRSIVLSLILSVVLFISVNSFATYMKEIAGSTKQYTTYDISVGTQTMDDREMLELYDKLKSVDGVYESLYQVVMKYSCIVNESDYLPMQIQFIDDDTYQNIIQDLGLPVEEYTGQNAKMVAVAKVPKEDQMEETDQLNDVFESSPVNLIIAPKIDNETKPEQGQSVSITFVNTALPDIPLFLGASQGESYLVYGIAPYSRMDKFKTTGIQADLMVKGMTFQSKNPSQSVEVMRTIIQDLKITGYDLINVAQMFEENQNYVFIANVFSYTFLIMISLIAVANVFNTISTNIKMRRRELAMLRSVGMSERDFQKMMNFECAFYGMKALVFGLPLALVFSFLIYKVITEGMDNIDFSLPWGSIGISVFGVLFIVFITMLYTVSKIKKENIIDALRADME